MESWKKWTRRQSFNLENRERYVILNNVVCYWYLFSQYSGNSIQVTLQDSAAFFSPHYYYFCFLWNHFPNVYHAAHFVSSYLWRWSLCICWIEKVMIRIPSIEKNRKSRSENYWKHVIWFCYSYIVLVCKS